MGMKDYLFTLPVGDRRETEDGLPGLDWIGFATICNNGNNEMAIGCQSPSNY